MPSAFHRTLGLRGSRTWHTLLASGISGHRRSGMIAAVSLRLLYLIFQQVLRLLLQLGRATSIKSDRQLIVSGVGAWWAWPASGRGSGLG